MDMICITPEDVHYGMWKLREHLHAEVRCVSPKDTYRVASEVDYGDYIIKEVLTENGTRYQILKK